MFCIVISPRNIGPRFLTPLIALALATAASGAEPNLRSISVAPVECSLRGLRSRQQLVVSAEYDNQRFGDETHAAKYESLDPGIAEVSSAGLIVPRRDGQSKIRVQWQHQWVTKSHQAREIRDMPR